jgi:hypothetical protein
LLLALKRLPLAVMPRRGPNVQAARKVYAYECWQQNLSWQDIQKEDRIKFGTQHRKLSRTSIKRYVSNGEKLRNAAYVKPKIYKAPHKKTMTVPQKRFMTLALLAVCTTSSVELDQRLVAAEVADGRDRFPVSTINETLRRIGFKHKKATLYNARRCPIESARARAALAAYDVRCVLVLDASHIKADAAQRKYGRALGGAEAVSSVFTCSGNECVSVMGAFSIDGFEMQACSVLVRPWRARLLRVKCWGFTRPWFKPMARAARHNRLRSLLPLGGDEAATGAAAVPPRRGAPQLGDIHGQHIHGSF